MRLFDRLAQELHPTRRGEIGKLAAMMGLFFLVVCAVGILRPIKNALALDGLGATDFYKVYLVSAVVVLFVPPYARLADRLPWRWLIPAVALFFALHLVLFRAFYQEGSATYGMLFYGWYDLFAAALVTQFFMATQLFFNARSAKHAYPIVIAGGSIGATLGGAITGFFAETVGTPNLLLVAAALIGIFGAGLPFVWGSEAAAVVERRGIRRIEKLTARGFRTVFANPQVQLIAASVLLTVLVKQLVDYQFNAISGEVFETRDAISAFQGKFNAATQWLPIVVVVALGPLMKRWGVGAAVFLLPVFMLVTSFGLAVWWGLGAAVAAKAADTGLRYSAERAGREVLYVPVPEDIKLKAKAYIDVAVEKGLGKALSAGLIFLLLTVMPYQQVAWVAVGLSLLWLAVVARVRREYVRTLAHSIRGRFASMQGVFASLADASTLGVVRKALADGDTLQTAFALDLIEQAGPTELRPFADELHRLLDHSSRDIRQRALVALARSPGVIDPEQVRAKLLDPARSVREAAVHALCAADPAQCETLVRELLSSEHAPIRTATLACLARREIPVDVAEQVSGSYLQERLDAAGRGDRDARIELALAAGIARSNGAVDRYLTPLLSDPDPAVAAAALRSAGMLRRCEYHPRMVAALALPSTRAAARDALALQDVSVVRLLSQYLLDENVDPLARRNIPAVLARIPSPAAVEALLHSFLAPETDQLLDYRTLKALSSLRAHHPELAFDPVRVQAAVLREVDAAKRYLTARASREVEGADGAVTTLLRQALREAWSERREGAFRCLGLLYSPEEVYRCSLAIAGGYAVPRANALEWLEHTVGHSLFSRLAPVLWEPNDAIAPGPAGIGVLATLWCDGDTWIAQCARAAAVELRIPSLSGRLDRLPPLPGWSLPPRAGKRSARLTGDGNRNPYPENNAMDLIERVLLLQRIDLLHDARSGHLALLASIAEEIEVEPGITLLQRNEPTDAMYVVVQGAIELLGMGDQLLVAGNGAGFGTWALIDEAPSLVEATAAQHSRLLRIRRSDFYDLLADHPELALGLLQGLARRVRTLVA